LHKLKTDLTAQSN